MTAPLEPRLDALERRVRELETELADLRRTMGSEAVPVAEAPEPRSQAWPDWAQELVDRGDFRRLLRDLERARREALESDDLDALAGVLELVELVQQEGPVGVQGGAARLAEATHQNQRFVQRKLRRQRDELMEGKPTELAPVEAAPRSPLIEFPELPEVSASDLLGAKALAIAGGIVTLLGIVFFFVLAVNRGWIGPGGRVALGAVASALVFSAGLELRRRFGETHSALAAVGAGIAGAYMVLLAAAALYDYIGHAAALGVAAAIAALGVAVALRWRSEVLAGIGLLGATLVPLAVVSHGHLSVLGTAFVAIMFAATATVAIWERWDGLLVAGAVAALAQALALVLRDEYRGESPTRVVALAAVFSAITVAAGIARQLRERAPGVHGLSAPFLFAGAAVAVGSAVRLYGSPESRGFALLAVALALVAAAAALFPRLRDRDLSALVGAIGLVIGGIAFGELMSGSPLAFAWAGEAAVLAWLSTRIREPRYLPFSGAYLVAALVHALAIDAPPSRVFRALETSAAGALALVATAVAAVLVGRFAGREVDFGSRHELVRQLTARRRAIRLTAYWLAALLAVDALSLGVLAAFTSFGWGHVAMYGLWSAIGLAATAIGLRRQSEQLRRGGLIWLGVTLVAAFANGEASLDSHPRGVVFLVVGAALLAGALSEQLVPRRRELSPVALGLVLASVGIGLAAFVALLGGSVGDVDERGLAFLGLALLYAGLTVGSFHADGQRDLATLLSGAALVLGYGASERLLPGTYDVLALSLAAGALAWLSLRVREPRFLVAAVAVVLVSVATAVVSLAPPGHLFRPHEHPGHGALAPILAALAAGVVAAVAGDGTELRRRGRNLLAWVAGVLAGYGLSLLLLALFQAWFAGSVDTNFHRGHTAVSAFWGLIGLALLYFGLTRLRALRVAGFAMFALSLAKIFLFDLPSLSSITRALSFLAVGAVLLLGGFFYQRLATAQPAQPRRRRAPLAWPEGLVRADLAVAVLAAVVLIVWFGSGTGPLGS